MADRRTVEWLMSSEDMPDVGVLLAELVSRPAWHRKAACKAQGRICSTPGEAASRPRRPAYCDECEVRSECLASAIEMGEHSDQGVWGGTSARTRRAMRRGVA